MSRLESIEEARLRQAQQLEVLIRLRQSDYDVFCLQEANPVERRCRFLAEKLGMRDTIVRCNAGIKLGEFGLPLHLSEGLLTLTGKGLRKRKITRLTLSGKAYQWKTPLGASFFAQLAERRCALMVESTLEGRRVAVVNLHLHHGSDRVPGNAFRRKGEIARLAQFLKRRANEMDLLAVCGDFNCDADSEVIEPLLDLGLEDCAKWTRKKQKKTWDPDTNPLTRISARIALKKDRKNLDWEARPHVFDRIYLRSKTPLQKIDLKRVCDAPMLSDHYGVLAEITF
jgi:endonuclease/exonuclease/phosphatase family metal-dependent hydrolase